ncbi:MAG: acetyl-CoA synthetase, partial [Clostridia bacterium]|nr:acetyl-CoA synthetase [Clostridia bacterium]
VLECAVTAVPHPERGQVVKATIVLVKNGPYQPTDQLKKELQTHVKNATAPYKYPRIIEFVDELPKTVSGKIQRKLIRTQDEEKGKA